MKKIYEIYEINSHRNMRCAVASSYKKAIEYVFANVKVEDIKINGEWVRYDIKKYLKKPQENISLYGGGNDYGYYAKGFRIIAIEII